MNPCIVVLKFGSSVLQTEADLPRAIEEIYREWRSGRQVVAVVSAFAGVTDRRFDQTRAVTDDLHEQAAWVAGGEEESGTKLAAALIANGVSALYVDARAVGLRAHGDPHESTPVSLNTSHLLSHLRDNAVIVVPGFIAQDLQGRCVLLGRGGSDLTALFLAKNLNARCRLLKDVDGVYESDPAVVENHAQRFDRLSWRTALEIGGRIIQPRVILDALESGVNFDAAVAHAQACGFAEADPHDDLMGLDAARKLELIARAAFGDSTHFELSVRGILGVTASEASLVREDGLSLKLVGSCERSAGHIRGVVKLHELEQSDFLAGARAEENRVEILTGNGEVIRLAGKGAGRWPTALSMLGDVHEYSRDRRSIEPDEPAEPVVVNA